MLDPDNVFKKNVEESKENWKKKFLELSQNVITAILGISLLVFLCGFPLIFNFMTVKLYAKILMIFGSLIGISYLLIFLEIFMYSNNQKKWIFYFSPLFMIYIIGLFCYIDFELWNQKDIIIGLLLCWSLFVVLFICIRNLLKNNFINDNALVVLISISLLLFFLGYINEELNLGYTDLCYKLSVGVGYLISFALYTDKYLYNEVNKEKSISSIIGLIFWGAVISISFPFYVKWYGITDANFSNFISIYSALLGGGITLAGVSLTIKHANNDKERDLVLQNRPIIYSLMFDQIDELKEKPLELFFCNDETVENPDKLDENENNELDKSVEVCQMDEQNNEETQYPIVLECIVNTDNSIVLVKKIVINDIEYSSISNNIIAKNKVYNLILDLYDISEDAIIKLYVEDILKNEYCYNIDLYICEDENNKKRYFINKVDEQLI